MSEPVECMLCGAQGDPLEMAPVGAPALGHHLDLAMAVQWFCPQPCFETYRNSPHLRARVHQWQDNCGKWARESVRQCEDAELRQMEELPEGLRITPSERARCAELRDKLDQVEDLQSDADNALLHKVCRNRNHNPFFHPQTGEMVEYHTLKENFAQLEKLTPEERRRLT